MLCVSRILVMGNVSLIFQKQSFNLIHPAVSISPILGYFVVESKVVDFIRAVLIGKIVDYVNYKRNSGLCSRRRPMIP